MRAQVRDGAPREHELGLFGEETDQGCEGFQRGRVGGQVLAVVQDHYQGVGMMQRERVGQQAHGRDVLRSPGLQARRDGSECRDAGLETRDQVREEDARVGIRRGEPVPAGRAGESPDMVGQQRRFARAGAGNHPGQHPRWGQSRE